MNARGSVLVALFLLLGASSVSWGSSSRNPFSNVSLDLITASSGEPVLRFVVDAAAAGLVTASLRTPSEIALNELSDSGVGKIVGKDERLQFEWGLVSGEDGYFLMEVGLRIDLRTEPPDRSPRGIPFASRTSYPLYVRVHDGEILSISQKPDSKYTSGGREDAPAIDPVYSSGKNDHVAGSSAANPTSQTISVDITGRVVYLYPHECYTTNPEVGVPGMKVRL
ncbi:MAG: hypothetical protein IH969_10405, partial [Candidatus Krumholzibacteriota bacterium]|nr:hypothetical protein [Candidatus Krumholzibacteriota bacterium]